MRSDAGRLWATRERPFPVAVEEAGAHRTVDADDLAELCQAIAAQESIAEGSPDDRAQVFQNVGHLDAGFLGSDIGGEQAGGLEKRGVLENHSSIVRPPGHRSGGARGRVAFASPACQFDLVTVYQRIGERRGGDQFRWDLLHDRRPSVPDDHSAWEGYEPDTADQVDATITFPDGSRRYATFMTLDVVQKIMDKDTHRRVPWRKVLLVLRPDHHQGRRLRGDGGCDS
ncbi:hypothetical protein [Microbispora bryophytorum]|uniref:hypothetical protein n=1 Tax=Microbispora bryophytorum TaxID=1460882 RepID=UPI003719B68D